MLRACAFVVASLCAVTASAQPKDRAPTEGDKGSAKALMQSGLKLFAQKDYLGALAVFRDAYARFPSDRILLNIGTTLIRLDRPAEAANAYQQYLDSPDADPKKRDEALRTLADLDKKVGVVELTVEPVDTEIQVGSDDWRPAAAVRRVRVMPGKTTISARREGYKDEATVLDLLAGSTKAATLKLETIPITTTTTSAAPTAAVGTAGIGTTYEGPAKPRSRIGALALAHVDPSAPGAAGVVGLVGDVSDRIGVRAAAILGPKLGGYAGASFALLTSRVRPIIAVAMPFFRSEGWRWSIRGAGGVEVAFNRNLSLIAELGVEHLFNPEDTVESATLFVPALGVSGRL